MERTLQDWTQHYEAELLPQRDEPDWMSKSRKQAWEIFTDLPEPRPLQRSLRRIPSMDLQGLDVYPASEQALPELKARVASWGELDGAYLESNGELISEELNPTLKDQGVILLSLSDALNQHPELVQKHFGKVYPAIMSKALALNMAYWRAGYFLYVPRGVQVELPIYALQSMQAGDQVLFSRSLVVVEDNAQLTLVHDAFSDTAAEAGWNSDVIEICVGQNAEVNALYVQQWNRKTHARTWAKAYLERDARYRAFNIGTGAQFHEAQTGAQMEHKGAETLLLGLFVGDGDQHFRQNSQQNHFSPHTYSDLQYHTVLRGHAYSFYHGMIYVDGKAQQTKSNQVNKNMLLSKDARADAIPNLEILADDVESGHGAAVASLDPEQRFYLMSRGFDQAMAEAMLVEAFMEAVILRFPHPHIQQRIQEHLSIRLLEPVEEV